MESATDRRESRERLLRQPQGFFKPHGVLGLRMLVVLGALAFATLGCSRAHPKPPQAPDKQAKADPGSERDDALERRHVAPPPAYGNKVVLANDENRATGRF